MIFFPALYEDELLYSAIARYHIRSGNYYYKHTTYDVFGNKEVNSSVYLPSNISNLVKNMPINSDIDENSIIMNHTLFPFYTAFLSKETSEKIYYSMKQDNGSELYNRCGICASNISIPEYLRFCPKCLNEDSKKYGEPYWHRVHQVQCVKVCPKHKVPLENSKVKFNSYYNKEYFAPNNENCIISKSRVYSADLLDKLYHLAKDVQYLLNSNFNRRELDWYKSNYDNYLLEKGFTTLKYKIKQRVLVDEFKEFYGDEFLDIVHSNINYEDVNNWLSQIGRKNRYAIHPIRQLLFIRFLGISIDTLFNIKYEYKPFGEGPWLCLNKASDHYQEKQIKNVEIKYSEHTHTLTGTFSCECGYTYIKYINDDKKTKVVKYGEVWQNKLKNLINSKEYSIYEIVNILGTNYETLYRHIINLNLEISYLPQYNKLKNYKKNNSTKEYNCNTSSKDKKIIDSRKKLLNILKTFPEKTRSEIKAIDSRLYVFLQKNDRDWLESNLPSKKNGRGHNSYIDWNKRDDMILKLVKSYVEELINTNERPVWININRIGKTLNIYELLQKNIDKLPKTAEFLNEVVEDKYTFIKRKIEWAIKKIIKENKKEINMTNIAVIGGIGLGDKKCKDLIKDQIDNFYDNKNSNI